MTDHSTFTSIQPRPVARATAECERMLPAVRRLLREGENCEQTAAQIRGLDIGTVTVGTAYSAFYPALARIMSEFHDKYLGIQVQFKNGFSTELLNQLNMHPVKIRHRLRKNFWSI